MKKILFVISILALVAVSCSQKKFDSVESTDVQRYSIAHKDSKCAVYDNIADSLVTALKYDTLRYGRSVTENGIDITVWTTNIDGATGLLSIIGESNETMEILFPKE